MPTESSEVQPSVIPPEATGVSPDPVFDALETYSSMMANSVGEANKLGKQEFQDYLRGVRGEKKPAWERVMGPISRALGRDKLSVVKHNAKKTADEALRTINEELNKTNS